MVYYAFDQDIDVALLNSLIVQSERSNAKIRAIICDMGNTKLLSKLNVYQTHNNFFENPFDVNRKVYIVCDIPHCFKNMRNHTLDYGMVIKQSEKNEIVIKKEMFRQLICDDFGDLRYCPKLSFSHIHVRGHDRQRVKTAVQLLSDSVSKALVIYMQISHE